MDRIRLSISLDDLAIPEMTTDEITAWREAIVRHATPVDVAINGEFVTAASVRDRHDAHMAVCDACACDECGMAPCGEYHHMGSRGNGSCNEQWCPWDCGDAAE